MRKVYQCEHTVPPVWWFTFADRNALGEEIVVEFRKNENTHGSVAVEIYNRWDGPIARVTTCLCDRSLAEDEAYVDTNNCPWAVELLEENGFAERTGRTRRSGYCEYPAMKFDRSKMAEFEEKR